MAIPIRAIPVLEGKVADRFLREMRKAEQERGSIHLSQQAKNLARQAFNDLHSYSH